MNKRIFFTLLFILSRYSFSCNVKTADTILIPKNIISAHLKSRFSFTGCTKKQTKMFLNLIKDYSGTLTNLQLNSEIPTSKISLEKPVIIAKLDHYLSKSLKLGESRLAINTSFTGQRHQNIALNEYDDISIECDQCETMGKKNIKLNIYTRKTNSFKQVWLKTEIVTQIKTLIPNNTLSVTNRSLSPKLFAWKKILTSKPEQYFTDLAQLSFYKLNRAAPKSTPLRKRSLSFMTLVHTNRPAIIQIKSGNIKIKGKALPNGPGKIGDTISLRNMKTKKTIVGKVIGHNLVEVQL